MRTWVLSGCLVAGVIAFCCLLSPPQVATEHSPQDHLSILEGRIVHSETGQPIGDVRLMLRTVTGTQVTRKLAVADASGGFRFEYLAARDYKLIAQHAGYLPSVYSPGSGPVRLTTVKLSFGREMTKLELRLTPEAEIAGTVVDQNNRPVPRAGVCIEDLGHVGGPSLGLVRADDAGKFQAGHLAPGLYRIAAGPASDSPPSTAPHDLRAGLAPFLPTADHAAAAPARIVVVEVAPGDQLTGLLIILPSASLPGSVRLASTRS